MPRARIGLALAVLLAGCGGSGHTRAATFHATGPGYSFSLPAGYHRVYSGTGDRPQFVDDPAARAAGAPSGADVIQWGDPDAGEPVVIQVTLIPVTEDTDAGVYDGAVADELKDRFTGAGDLTAPARLADVPAAGVHGMQNGILNQALVAHRGAYSYVLNVSAYPSHASRIAAVMQLIARSWRFDAPDAGALARLGKLHGFRGTGYRVRLPAGWGFASPDLATGPSAPPGGGLDARWRGHVDNPAASTSGTVAVADARGEPLQQLAAQVIREERRQAGVHVVALHRSVARLDGEPAVALDIQTAAPGPALAVRELVAVHHGKAYRTTLATPADRAETDAPQFDALLASWTWAD